MTPGQYPLAIYRGDTYRWQFVLWADDTRSQPADLTGVTPKAQIRGADKAMADIACSVVLPNTVEGVLTAEVSKTLSPGKGTWDLQLTHADGDVATVLAGPVTVTANVTNSGA